MAALYAYEIDNCLIEVNAPEFPILDGSSRFFSEEIRKAGIVEQNAPKDFYIVKHKIEVKDEETGSSLIILPDEKFSVNVLISFRFARFIQSVRHYERSERVSRRNCRFPYICIRS